MVLLPIADDLLDAAVGASRAAACREIRSVMCPQVAPGLIPKAA
jgi:hypothetical protein